jgi:hypothetical protein
MSKETSRNFKSKRKKAELNSKIYYFTVLPFLFHHLFKLFYYLFFRPKFLKSSNNFAPTSSDDLTLTEGSFGTDFKIFKKIPLPNESAEKNKFKARWFAKLQNDQHSIREVMTSEIFQLLLGKQYAAKVRLMRDAVTGKIYTLSKLFENFQTFQNIRNKAVSENKGKEGYPIYIETTENLQGFKKMLAVSLLLSREDCHEGNWGVVENPTGKFVATFDYGVTGTESPFNMYDLLKTRGHFYQHIVCEEFVKICEDLIEQFEQNHDEIETLLLEGRAAAQAVYGWWKAPTANEFMDIFSNNKRQLKHLCYHIRAELAILQGNPKNLGAALEKLDPKYVQYFSAMSLQNRHSFFFMPSHGLNALIPLGYNRVFICSGELPKNFKFEQGALYLVEQDDAICVYADERERLSQKQVAAVRKHLTFPEKKESFTMKELSFEMSQTIITLCEYPQKKSPEIQAELLEVYNKHYYKPSF